jgi:hypothetical protein
MKANQILLCREIIAVCFKNDMKQIITVWGKVQNVFNVKASGVGS